MLRRDEAREQAERHRLQMEMMLDRVTQIPTLFERHSQVNKIDFFEINYKTNKTIKINNNKNRIVYIRIFFYRVINH